MRNEWEQAGIVAVLVSSVFSLIYWAWKILREGK